MNKDKIFKIIGIILYATAFAAIVAYSVTLYGNDIWYDEVFSVFFSSSSFSEIVRLTTSDVHPPLYYFYLKLVMDAGTAIFGKGSLILFAKLASFLPWAVLFILAVFPVRKRFGVFTGGLFIFLMSVMPKLGSNYAEIRMYSFAMMLITISFTALIALMNENNEKAAIIVFLLSGIATAYTQYYACVATVGLYIGYGIYALCTGKKKHVKWLFICAGFSILLYLPWIGPLRSQMSAVSDEYWILPLTLRSLPGCLKFLFLPSDGAGALGYVCAVLVIALIALIYVLFLMKKRSADEVFIALAGPGVLAFTVLTGFVLSIIGRPIFVYRYMIPVLGAFYLSVAFAFYTVAQNKARFLFTLLIFAFCGRMVIGSYRYEEKLKCDKMKEAEEVLSSIPKDGVIVTNFDHVCTLISYYLPDNTVYLYEGRPDCIVELMYNRSDFELSEDELADQVRSGKKVYFFGSFNSREDLLEDWKEKGIENTEEYDSVLIERYYFNIYRLSDEKQGNKG
ncbi:MAG: hypothetical protein K5888_11400 [Lachnospiraceae bacterium]|nr:hypothetical protein [Lachnospiraceae bacterium]